MFCQKFKKYSFKSSKEHLYTKIEDGAFGCKLCTNKNALDPRPYRLTVFPVTLEEQLCSQNGCFLGIFVHSDRTGTAVL